ncbi:hypothetical protein ACJRO7_035528 [Eucalyptus globulus]|uniref:RING-type domain-containing protein n=1 Tax=Eucalyptus globulus TaxID=34317 RepID=A0ABD3J933_EUCGL
MPPSPYPSAAPTPPPLPPPPDHAMVGLRFTAFALYASLLACLDAMLILIVVGYAYCFRWRNRARFDPEIEMPRQQVEATALSVMVMKYRGDAREFNSDECVICLASFEEGEECWVIETCDHVYHESCIKEWLSRNRHCPLCRGSVQAAREASLTPAPTRS